MPIDVLLVDDHKIMRDGIKAILSRSEEFRVVGEAASGPDAVQFVKRKAPAMVLMDIGLPGLNGVETTAEILRYFPECKIVILSMYDDEESVVTAIRSGARGFILKKASDMDLVEALRMVARGGAYLKSRGVRPVPRTRTSGATSNRARLRQPIESLSPREVQVLRMVADGKTSKEIATVLDLREQTIRSYRKTMMKKLKVNNVAGLTQLAMSSGRDQSVAGPRGAQVVSWSGCHPARIAVGASRQSRTPTFTSFSHHFFQTLIAQKPGLTWDDAAAKLGWRMPTPEPEALAAHWVAELDRHGVAHATLIASIPGR
jgi:DNA-binding NarL/FixJ family response regulator